MRKFSIKTPADEEVYSRQSCWVSYNYYDIKILNQWTNLQKMQIVLIRTIRKESNGNRVIKKLQKWKWLQWNLTPEINCPPKDPPSPSNVLTVGREGFSFCSYCSTEHFGTPEVLFGLKGSWLSKYQSNGGEMSVTLFKHQVTTFFDGFHSK